MRYNSGLRLRKIPISSITQYSHYPPAHAGDATLSIPKNLVLLDAVELDIVDQDRSYSRSRSLNVSASDLQPESQ